MCMLNKIFSFKEGKSGRIEILYPKYYVGCELQCFEIKINSLNKIS